MRSRGLQGGVALILALITIPAVPVVSAPPKPPVLSKEGCFSVADPERILPKPWLRSLYGFEKEFLALTGYSPSSFPPVIIGVRPAAGSAVRPSLRVDELEGGLPKIQIDLTERTEWDSMTAELMARALLLRQYYGTSSPGAGSRIEEFPAWVTRGLGKLCLSAEEANVTPLRYLRGEAPPTVESFTAERPPSFENNALGAVYDTMASLLLKSGLQGSGAASFREWIGHSNPTGTATVRPSLPPGWKLPVLERRWLLAMAAAPHQQEAGIQVLGMNESLRRYDAIMADLSRNGKSLAILRKEKGGDFTARQIRDRLVALRLQANPLIHPLIDKTLVPCATLKRFSEKKLLQEEKEAAELRAALAAKANSIESYLDWYEATKIQVRSGLFDRLLATPPMPVKKGPVGRYLDAVEARGW